MKIKDLLKKVLDEGLEKLTPEERTMLDQYEDVDYEKLANDRAAKARREAEEKLAKMEEARKKLEQEMSDLMKKKDDEAHSKMTDLEKLQARLAKLEKDYAEAQQAREKAEKANVELARSVKLDKIFSQLPLVEGVDPETARAALERRLSDADLDDPEMVQLRVQEFKDKNKALIRAVGVGGGGSGNEGGSGAQRGGRQEVDLDDLVTQAEQGDLEAAEKAVNGAGTAIKGGNARLKGNS